ncbi:MAG: flagellar biosynthetic protein FliQ [Rhodospirillales bacterium 69-11]|nr:flagellar biosynthetic protein FliQ [Rhodospirillales bacterium]OJW24080.1 MAG: flagellar biosynthetic protein FliQ [Rhodospirillales bacterium 69-11]
MGENDVAGLLRTMLLVIAKLGGPLLAIALVVGLLVSLVQAVTQINEATLSFVPKVAALGVALVLLGPFMAATLSNFALLLFDRMVAIGGG